MIEFEHRFSMCRGRLSPSRFLHPLVNNDKSAAKEFKTAVYLSPLTGPVSSKLFLVAGKFF